MRIGKLSPGIPPQNRLLKFGEISYEISIFNIAEFIYHIQTVYTRAHSIIFLGFHGPPVRQELCGSDKGRSVVVK